MENVVIASFDPTVFGVRTLSDLHSHQSIKWSITTRDYPRLCTAHLALRVPIVLTTSANIRKYHKAGVYPEVKAIYYDPFTRFFHCPTPIRNKEQVFSEIINRHPTDTEMVRFFKRCHNIAKQRYTRPEEHSHMPKAKAINLDESEDETDEDKIDLINHAPSKFLHWKTKILPIHPIQDDITQTDLDKDKKMDMETRINIARTAVWDQPPLDVGHSDDSSLTPCLQRLDGRRRHFEQLFDAFCDAHKSHKGIDEPDS